jgi:serine/threonine protein kinase
VQRLGKYEIVSELGRGGMGVVYKARDPLINRLVALKTLTGNLIERPDLLERFLQEARSAGTLQHPNIVIIYELGEEHDAPYIAMEYIDGLTLEAIIERQATLTLAVKLGHIVQVSEGLQYAHEHGVIHRDIKPGNIMVNSSGVAKVVDFGIARVMDTSMTQVNSVLGSRAYMAPELYRGERADAGTDIWALGVTLFELLTHQKPFQAETEAGIMFNVLKDDPPHLRDLCPDCPKDLENVVKRMLEKSDSARFQNMGEVVRDLRPIWKQSQNETVQRLLLGARTFIETRDFLRAQEILRNALQVEVTNVSVKRLLDEVSKEILQLEGLPRLQEHLSRGRTQLQAGNPPEARREVEKALEIDSRHEGARSLLGDIEEAAKRAETLRQLLRLAKQRMVEGALTEAQGVLEKVLKSHPDDEGTKELKLQISEELGRRDRRKQLTTVQQRVRELWMDLKYAECLALLDAELKQFPGDSELVKLRETAKQDWAEEEKQKQLGVARKLLGQQQFGQALAILGKLEKDHPQDNSVAKLRHLVEQGEAELRQQERLAKKLSELRELVRQEKYAEAAAQGEALAREYQDEYELKELVRYARAELTQRQLQEKEQDLANHIQELLRAKRYAEAAGVAQGALREFSGHQKFQKLFEEAEKKRDVQALRDEYQSRILEIQRRITRQELTEAIDIAQQTLATMGPNKHVSQLLQAARMEREEKSKRGSQDPLNAVETLVHSGNFQEATRILNDAFATGMLHPSQPKAKGLLARIAEESAKPRTQVNPPSTEKDPVSRQPTRTFSSELSSEPMPYSATNVLSQTPPPLPASSESSVTPPPKKVDLPKTFRGRIPHEREARPGRSESAVQGVESPRIESTQAQRVRSIAPRQKFDLRKFAAAQRHHAVLIGLFLRNLLLQTAEAFRALAPLSLNPRSSRRMRIGVVIGILIAGGAVLGINWWRIYLNSHLPSSIEIELRKEAEQSWARHEPDQSEGKWKQIQALHGPLEGKATEQVSFIERTRADEQQLFDDGNRLLHMDVSDLRGRQFLQKVVEMHLWHSTEAQDALNIIAQSVQSTNDLSAQEQHLFAQGEDLFKSGNFDVSRRQFLDLLNLQIPNSSLRSKAQEYLIRIRGLNDDRKNYDAALEDMKDENWDSASDGFRSISSHRSSFKDEAQKQLEKIASAQAAINEVAELVRSHSYPAARSKLDSMGNWPKSSDRLRQELVSAEQQEFTSVKSRSLALFQKQDIPGLERLQGELDNLSGRVDDASLLQPMQELSRTVSSQLLQLKKEQSSDKPAFDKAERDFQQARSESDINSLRTEVLHEFYQIAQGNGYNHVAAQAYVNSVIPDSIKELTQILAAKGQVTLPPISCTGTQVERTTIENDSHTIPCARLDVDPPLRWIGNPTVDVPPNAKREGKLPYTLHLIVIIDGSGRVLHVDKDGPADQEFLRKAKDAAKRWRSSLPLLNGKTVNASFPIDITFQP